MKARCTNANNKSFKNYGGRGITVCERWRKFENFIADMGRRPSSAHTIERKNNDQGYRPDNCVWVPRSEQSGNRRNSRRITARGETLTVAEWSRRTGLNYTTIQRRLDVGWDPERALSPVK